MANTLRVGDTVNQAKNTTGAFKINGVVKYVACWGATKAGGKLCDKKTCSHSHKDYVWVEWPDGTTFSYDHNELVLAKSNTGTQPYPSVVTSKQSSVTREVAIPKDSPAPISDKDMAALEGFVKKVAKKITSNPFEQQTLSDNEVDFDRYNGLIRTRPYQYRKGQGG